MDALVPIADNPAAMKPALFPVLRYQDAPNAIRVLIGGFGFESRSDHRTADGAVAHADLGFGAGTVGVSSAGASLPDSPWSGVAQGIYIVVDHPDAHYERAQAAGADIAAPIADHSYGSRDFTLRDPEGHLWGFGTYDMARREGDSTLFPEVLYKDGYRAVTWLEDTIGFTRGLVVPDPSGSLMHAELHLDGSTLFVGSAPSSDAFRGLTHFVNLHVADPDTHFARATAAGAIPVMEPQLSGFGARFYAARDPEGFLWWVSTYKPSR